VAYEGVLDDDHVDLNQKQADLARELESETRKRVDAEEAYEKLKEEFLKMELEDSRIKSEL
jgi:hypothetical protein